MKLSELKNEEALDVLADLIEPAADILADENVKDLITKGGDKLTIAKTIIKGHKKSIIEILAILDGVPVDEYEVGLFALPIKVVEILNDKDLISFFQSQVTMEE